MRIISQSTASEVGLNPCAVISCSKRHIFFRRQSRNVPRRVNLPIRKFIMTKKLQIVRVDNDLVQKANLLIGNNIIGRGAATGVSCVILTFCEDIKMSCEMSFRTNTSCGK